MKEARDPSGRARLNQPREGISGVSDEALIFRLWNDDAAALDELVSRYWRPLVNYLANITEDHDTAHDIAQETFVRLWQRRQLWDPRGSVAVWLFRTGRNLAISDHRKRKVRARWTAMTKGSEPAPPTPLQHTEAEELRATVAAALRQLSPRRCEALTLFYLRDFSYREIGAIMGIRPQSVANHLQAGLADLRGILRQLSTSPPTT